MNRARRAQWDPGGPGAIRGLRLGAPPGVSGTTTGAVPMSSRR